MRTAHLRFRNGDIVKVEVTSRHGNIDKITVPAPGAWPYQLRFTRPVLAKERVRRFMRPPLNPEAPVRTSEEIAEFHIDRESFDPERHWQNYIEVE